MQNQARLRAGAVCVMLRAMQAPMKRLVAYVMVGLAVAVGVYALSRRPERIDRKTRRIVFGTVPLKIIAVAPKQTGAAERLEAAVAAAAGRFAVVNRRMSAHRPDSTLAQVNAHAATQPVDTGDDRYLSSVLLRSVYWARETDGAFDVTCGPLVQLWRRHDARDVPPDPAAIEAARSRVDSQAIRLSASDQGGPTVRLDRPGMRLDLGGIAKGFAIDMAIVELSDERRLTGGLVDCGGDVRCFGKTVEGDAWHVGVQSPFDDAVLVTLVMTDRAVATSGNYRRFVTIGGRRYSHIIDPRTGRPADAVPSVTVIAPNATDADALATAVSVLGVAEGLALIERLADTEAMLVTGTPDDYRMHKSQGFAAFILPADQD